MNTDYLDLYNNLSVKYGERLKTVSQAKTLKAFELAWQYGHANGENSVENYFTDLIDLIK